MERGDFFSLYTARRKQARDDDMCRAASYQGFSFRIPHEFTASDLLKRAHV